MNLKLVQCKYIIFEVTCIKKHIMQRYGISKGKRIKGFSIICLSTNRKKNITTGSLLRLVIFVRTRSIEEEKKNVKLADKIFTYQDIETI